MIDDMILGLQPPVGNRTRLADWYADDTCLVAVSRPPYGDRAIQLLPYGLQGLEGRELHLVVPPAAADPIRARAALLDLPVLVHVARPDAPTEALENWHLDEALDWYRRLGDIEPLYSWDNSSWPVWLIQLIDWLESRRVERVQTKAAYSWHYRGRQVLHLRVGKKSHKLIVGVNYRDPKGDQPSPFCLEVLVGDDPPPGAMDAARRALDEAIERRRVAADDGHREHLLQAAIGTDPSLIGVAATFRELPAWRPKQQPRRGRGYVDFVATDIDRIGHVVETKIGPDAQLGVQVIDYWAWVEAHRTRIADQVGADPEQPFKLDVVLARSSKPLMHPAAAETLRALVAPIDWRVHVLENWDTIERPNQLLMPDAPAPLRPRQLPLSP